MLRVMTYNIETGGVDDDGTSRLAALHRVVASVAPDVLAVQEANDFDRRGHRRLHAFEQATGMRGLLARSPSEFHGALVLRPALQPTFHEAYGFLTQSVMHATFVGAGSETISVAAVHLDPVSPDLRAIGARYALNARPPALIMGDFNQARHDDPVAAETFARLTPRHRALRLHDAGEQIFGPLEDAGFVDLYRRFHPDDPGYTSTRGGGLRLDYIFASRDLADRAVSCEIVDHPDAAAASDHVPLVAELDV